MVVDIDLVRNYFTDKYTLGKLYISGEYVCDTLEPSRIDKSHPCIPLGSYAVVLRQSSKFNKLMPCLLSVPNRSGILIHSGNTYRDTSGCILVGYNDSVGMVLQSKRCFAWLMSLFASTDDSIIIHIKNK